MTIVGYISRRCSKIVADQVLAAWSKQWSSCISGGLQLRSVRDISIQRQHLLEKTHNTNENLGGWTLDLIKAFNLQVCDSPYDCSSRSTTRCDPILGSITAKAHQSGPSGPHRVQGEALRLVVKHIETLIGTAFIPKYNQSGCSSLSLGFALTHKFGLA